MKTRMTQNLYQVFFMFIIIEMFIETPCAPSKDQIIKGDSM